MEITETQYQRIECCLPRQRGSVKHSNLQVLNAILYVAGHGCKWRGLPKRFGNWHTIYTCMNRWAKSGVLSHVFGQLQHQQIIRIRIEAVSPDSTSIKVHPGGTGVLKKRPAIHRKIPRWMDHQKFIWLPQIPEQPQASPSHPVTPMMHRKADNFCFPPAPSIRPPACRWIAFMKAAKPANWR